MGRPEPCVLFAQSFVHSQLDEYVDEVLFSEPVVVTACELLEQNASPSSPNVSLIGATSPPSFALEVFVHCEGESRFRRLCQPFLYSHSSSNVLEVEAVVTNHLVLRGCYRSITLVVYGNTAEDCGEYNIEFDLNNSLANVVHTPTEGKLEDLPPALHPTRLIFEESIPSLRFLRFPFPALDIPPEMKQFLQLALKICQISTEDDTICKLVATVVSAVSSYTMNDNNSLPIYWDHHVLSGSAGNEEDPQHVNYVISQATTEIFEVYRSLQLVTDDTQSLEDGIILESEADLPTSKLLVDMFNESFPFFSRISDVEPSVLSQNKEMIIGLSMALLLCTSRESCFHFINDGRMEQIVNLFCDKIQKSTAITLMLLGIVEFATRHGIGCEGFLGWWPRVDDNVLLGKSDGYCYLLKLLFGKQRHDVASLASYILHRLSFFETVAKYESAVLCLLNNFSDGSGNKTDGIESLVAANSLLKQILKLLTFCGPVEDPSPLASARTFSLPGQSEVLLSYTATSNIIDTSKFSFAKQDIDTYLLSLLKEKGFIPLSTALLSSPILRSSNGMTAEIFMDIVTSIESIILTLLFHRSGLCFLLAQPEATELMILSLQDAEDTIKTDCITLRQATVCLSKGFFCRPQEVGMITEIYLRVGTAIDRLLTAPHSDGILWVLWELFAISRSDSGRQALLALGHFPEAVLVLLEELRSFKDVEPTGENNGGTSPLSLAIFHSAAEIFEVLITDATASSLRSWIGHAVELHKALHSSSPGPNRKDAPTRLLECIDAGVVYHRNGVIGLLRYAAVLASGGDAHLSSTNILVSDSVDVENVVGDSTNGLDSQIVDNLLGKFVSDKYFDGITLRNTSIVQLTTSFRILSILSENSAVAASLFEESALTVIYVVLLNCKFMLEGLSNTCDYLVDEGAECNSTSDLLLGRSHEQGLLDLMIPSLVFLINLLQKLKETKEQYRNKKLLNALLKLHREVSPKLAACAADLSFPYPSSSIGFGAVSHLLASALAFWPIFGWTPGLFHCVLESVQATSLLALGPKDACSMLCLLGDLFPEEGIWLWTNKMPPLTALRTLSIGTVLGAQLERDINWYLQPEHLTVLLIRLTPQLDRIAQIVLHFSFTALTVMQDMIRIFIVRIACQRIEYAVVLLRPIISWLDNHIDGTTLSDTDIFKVYRLLDFVASLLEHPRAKTLLLKAGAVKILQKVLQRCCIASLSDEKLIIENKVPESITILGWCLPALKSVAYLLHSQASIHYSPTYDKCLGKSINTEDNILVGRYLLKLCQVLPVGKELLACVLTFKELVSFTEGRSAIISIYPEIQSSAFEEQEPDEREADDHIVNYVEWRWSAPFFNCWNKLLSSLDIKDIASSFFVDTISALASSAISLSMQGKSSEGVAMLKCLFGLQYDPVGAANSSNEKTKIVHEIIEKLERGISEELSASNRTSTLYQVMESVKLMLHLLESASTSSEGIVPSEDCISPSAVLHSMTITTQLMSSQTGISMDEVSESSSFIWKLNRGAEKTGDDFTLGGLSEMFQWECPDSSPIDRQQMPAAQTARRKSAPAEGTGRRMRENVGSEATGSNAALLSRGFSIPSVSSVPNRRDTFRQRKPNTSRPPSMHVDDYVARERNTDGVSSGSNIVSSSHHRGGSTSGRPPSIHVDEFMARQRERQYSIPVVDASRTELLENENGLSKLDRSQQLRADLDDDLQGINIVFDDESESDDKVPFPQPDDNLQQPAPVVVTGESSPGSVVEETEGDSNEGSTLQASEDGGRSASGSDMIPFFAQEISKVSVEKKYPAVVREQSDESRYVSPAGGSSRGFSTNLPPHSSNVMSSLPQPLPPFLHRNSPQKHHPIINQPPLPTVPRPNLPAEPMMSQSSPYLHTLQPPLSSGYTMQAFDASGININNVQSGNLSSTAMWNASGSRLHGETSAQAMPPLPPCPPPFSSAVNPTSQMSFNNQTGPPPSTPMNDPGFTSLASYTVPSFTPPMMINRPSGTFFSSPAQHSSLGLPQQLMQPPPPPPPPPHPPRFPLHQSEQMMALQQQSAIQVQLQPLQIPQNLTIPQLQFFYQPQQQEALLQPLQPVLTQGESTQQQQQESGMTLQDYFASPESIQALLSDRDKLCQLLEQHPKLMKMLQERLGQ